jgi:hypothetical protein
MRALRKHFAELWLSYASTLTSLNAFYSNNQLCAHTAFIDRQEFCVTVLTTKEKCPRESGSRCRNERTMAPCLSGVASAIPAISYGY